jgi:ODP family beta lactamase
MKSATAIQKGRAWASGFLEDVMARIDEIAPDLFRISIYLPQIDLQFNHFLIRDEEPLLFHTGMRRMFPEVRDAVSRVLDPASIRWISWSHFEVDECGALNDWLAIAPRAQAACSQVGVLVNLQDFAARPPRGLSRDEVIDTGRHRFASSRRRICRTAGTPAFCSRKTVGSSSARTFSTRLVTASR